MLSSLKRRRPLFAALILTLNLASVLAFIAGPPDAEAFTTAPQVISPKTILVHLEQAQQFTSAGATKWKASEGQISASGSYVAPTTMPKSATVTITATGPGGSATATVTLVGGPLQVASPSVVNLALGKTQQFKSAGVISWKPLYGKISSTGLYTAPATWPGAGEDVISVYGLHGSTTARVFFIPPVPAIKAIVSGSRVPVGVFKLVLTGSNIINESVIFLNGAALTTTVGNGVVSATGFVGQPETAKVQIHNGTSVSAAVPLQVGILNPKVSAAAARRFLEQAAFGPSPTDIAAVQTLGFQGWINQQIAMKPCANFTAVKTEYGGMPAHFLTNAVNCDDELRQRVAFALSEIYVTSLETLVSNQNMISYQDMLLADAFVSYRKIMSDVTLSQAMGQYLNMANNAVGDPAQGSSPNQNYARELMQLFTIGTNMLNPDGTLQLDSTGLPIPTYSQFQVTEFARVYTGWTYAPSPGVTETSKWGIPPTGYGPMVYNSSQHDSGSKQLLNGYVSPAGASPVQDLNNALNNIFAHPNVGPFVCTQLIQHLVKSNPSPAYVKRVAAVFNEDESGTRGNMSSVITAILLDPEARANDEGGEDQPADGHLQEPALFIAGMVRAFGGTMSDENNFIYDLTNQGQNLFTPASVFNFYAPNTGVQGTTLMGGEFQIYTPNAAVLRANMVSGFFGAWQNWVQINGAGTSVDLTPFVEMAGNPTQLVTALDLTLMHGTMPAEMKSAVLTAVEGETGGNLRRAQRGIYLILTSGYYNIWH